MAEHLQASREHWDTVPDLHDHKRSGLFWGPSFFQPIRLRAFWLF